MKREPTPLLPFWPALLVAAISGPVLDAGFPDRNLWPLTLVGIALVLLALIGRRASTGLLLGFVAGLTFYLVHIEWASLFLGPIPMTALAVLQSLFFALGAMLISLAYRWVPRAAPGPAGRLALLPLVVAGIWTAREGISSVWPYGGFAWGRAALSQSEGPFAELFAWVGVSGVSFLLVALVALTIEAFRVGSVSRILRGAAVAGAFVLLLVVPAFPVAYDGTTTIAAVQGNGKAAYFDAPLRQRGDLLQAQLDATRPIFGEDVDMVVWPEGATDLNPLGNATAASVFDLVSSEMDAPLIAGAITERDDRIYNTSLLWREGEGAVDFYDKRHPIPFGEYVPDREFWEPFAPDLIGLIQREYTAGTTDTVLDVGGVLVGANICFDISDDVVMRESVVDGARVLLAQTNNADFGRTDESEQQLAIARVRALELGRSVVNISTVGTSAIIAPDGSTIDQLPVYTAASMIAEVPLSSTMTPAAIFGATLEQILAGLGLVGLAAAGVIARGQRRPRG